MGKLMQMVSCKYLLRTRGQANLRKLPSLRRKVACPKKKLKGWLKRLSSLPRKTKKSKTASMAVMGLKVIATTLRTLLRSKKQSRKHLNGLMTTKKQKRRNLKQNKKNLNKLQTQSSKRFIKLELVALPVVHLKMMKTWMTKTVMNCKTLIYYVWEILHTLMTWSRDNSVYAKLVKQMQHMINSHLPNALNIKFI